MRMAVNVGIDLHAYGRLEGAAANVTLSLNDLQQFDGDVANSSSLIPALSCSDQIDRGAANMSRCGADIRLACIPR
jgi:hypothetical protein